MIVEQIIADSRLVVNAKIGNSEPLHCSSVGKCLLANANSERKTEMLSQIGYEKYTDNTIITEEALRIELDKIVERGYAIDNGELSKDIKCIAAPIFNSKGECIHALGISGAESRMTQEKITSAAALLIRVAQTVSIELGYCINSR
jgi:DNA-binding IclR family transcriptional regulator